MQQLFRSTPGRVGLGISGAVLLSLVAVVAIYVFGPGPTGRSGGSGATNTPAAAPTLAATKDSTLFTLDSTASEASFTIDEMLFGQPNTVVGKTNQVTGQILINTTDPSQSQLGQIRVDVSTLVTDNSLRNHTLQNRILETSDPANQFATFVAKSLAGLPNTTAGHSFGDSVSFQTTGDLTIHQVTRAVTFDVKMTAQSATHITGHAQATVRYSDFDIAIPDVPSVSGVSDNVVLALDFTAHT